ncbi:MAG: hypothetical protein GF333_04800 [Candidatus Omnitrophica bacterium]|nr:hypothetical protein [Candidatus Omnitrophota bacterium]
MARLLKGVFACAAGLCLAGRSVPAEAAFRLGKDGPRIGGFVEAGYGGKLGDDTTKHEDLSMLEQRLQLETTWYPEFAEVWKDWMAAVNFRGDFLLDEYYGGRAEFELRELNLILSPLSWMDLRMGRQVFTWGTGDYLFLNDLFPKDYISFYIGRDDEYLKKPSDGVRVSFYTDPVNLDLALIPVCEPNDFFTGQRLSFYDVFQQRIAARSVNRTVVEPARQPEHSEVAMRAYRNFGRYEFAWYAFRGHYKMPRGILNQMQRRLYFPRLDAYGMSVRGPFYEGIANAEFAYYHSREDSAGDNRLIPNSMCKYLVGYDQDLGNDLRIGVQYLLEQRLEYDSYRRALLPGDVARDEFRHLLTLRINQQYWNQTVDAGLFLFFSPSDRDAYLRPKVDYDVTDQLSFTFGANLIWGEDDSTEFGQLERNKNVYLRVRYAF